MGKLLRLVVLVCAGGAGSANAAIITFEEPNTPIGGGSAGNVINIGEVSFANSTFSNSNTISGHSEMSTSKYNVMNVASPFGPANNISLVSGGTFDFLGAAFACSCAEYNNSSHYVRAGTDVQIRGYLDGHLVDEFLLPMAFLKAEFQVADLTGIDQLTISTSRLPSRWSRNGRFTMDDLQYSVSPVSPDAPTIDSIGPGDGQATITFTPGADNGLPITGYRAIRDDGAVTSIILGTTGSNPNAIGIDAAGNIYTANYYADNVSKITPNGISTIFAATGSGPTAITLDADGNVYTANSSSNDVWKITPDGTSSILAAATPVPTSPLWLLGMMAGLLSLVAVRKLRKA